ncbi:hypothetical protein M2405_004027 [Rhodococcus erythropolis]|nr:hypothetical protein [Rhodococcus erythropolis]MCW2425238.1 hypothetical protein [Rhodococcus erythropolis]
MPNAPTTNTTPNTTHRVTPPHVVTHAP